MPFSCIDLCPSSCCHLQTTEQPAIFIKDLGTWLTSILLPFLPSSFAITWGNFNGHINILAVFCTPFWHPTTVAKPWTLSSLETTQTSLFHFVIIILSFNCFQDLGSVTSLGPPAHNTFTSGPFLPLPPACKLWSVVCTDTAVVSPTLDAGK